MVLSERKRELITWGKHRKAKAISLEIIKICKSVLTKALFQRNNGNFYFTQVKIILYFNYENVIFTQQ